MYIKDDGLKLGDSRPGASLYVRADAGSYARPVGASTHAHRRAEVCMHVCVCVYTRVYICMHALCVCLMHIGLQRYVCMYLGVYMHLYVYGDG